MSPEILVPYDFLDQLERENRAAVKTTVNAAIFDNRSRRWLPYKNLAFSIKDWGITEDRSLARNPWPNANVASYAWLKGHWQNSAEKPLQVQPVKWLATLGKNQIELDLGRWQSSYRDKMIVPKAIDLKAQAKTAVSYSAQYNRGFLSRVGVFEPMSRLSTELVFSMGNRLGRIILPAMRFLVRE